MENKRADEYLKANNLPRHQLWASEAILKFPYINFFQLGVSLGKSYTYSTPGGAYNVSFLSNNACLYMVPFQIDIKITNPISTLGQQITLLISNADTGASQQYINFYGDRADNFTTGGAIENGEVFTLYYGRTKWGKFRHKTQELLTGSLTNTGKRFNIGLSVTNVATAPPITTTLELVDSGRQFTII